MTLNGQASKPSYRKPDMRYSDLSAQLAEARLLLGKLTAMTIQIGRIEQMAKIDGACVEEAEAVAKYIEQCDRFCAEYDRRLSK